MFKGGGDLVHLDQVVPRLGTGFADRFHGAAHTGEGITDRNQAAVLSLLHSLSFSHARQTRQRSGTILAADTRSSPPRADKTSSGASCLEEPNLAGGLLFDAVDLLY